MTSRMPMRLPRALLAVGLATLLPFLFCAGAVLATTDTRSAGWMTALLGYAAVVLALYGGVHWGFLLAAAEPRPSDRLRLALGVVPALIGWAALLITLVLPNEVGLGVLIVGYAAFALSESRLYSADLLPSGYMWLRWGHTLAVVTVLVALLVLRLLGAHIVV
jgi:uncharacterized protein DUF3429